MFSQSKHGPFGVQYVQKNVLVLKLVIVQQVSA